MASSRTCTHTHASTPYLKATKTTNAEGPRTRLRQARGHARTHAIENINGRISIAPSVWGFCTPVQRLVQHTTGYAHGRQANRLICTRLLRYTHTLPYQELAVQFDRLCRSYSRTGNYYRAQVTTRMNTAIKQAIYHIGKLYSLR